VAGERGIGQSRIQKKTSLEPGGGKNRKNRMQPGMRETGGHLQKKVLRIREMGGMEKETRGIRLEQLREGMSWDDAKRARAWEKVRKKGFPSHERLAVKSA